MTGSARQPAGRPDLVVPGTVTLPADQPVSCDCMNLKRSWRVPSHCWQYPDIEWVRFLAPPKMFPPAGPVWLRNSPEFKWPKREAGRSPDSSAEAKNKWSYTSASLHGVDRAGCTFIRVSNPRWPYCRVRTSSQLEVSWLSQHASPSFFRSGWMLSSCVRLSLISSSVVL
jgi:hypothetical protein